MRDTVARPTCSSLMKIAGQSRLPQEDDRSTGVFFVGEGSVARLGANQTLAALMGGPDAFW
jgi:hypothetical protein